MVTNYAAPVGGHINPFAIHDTFGMYSATTKCRAITPDQVDIDLGSDYANNLGFEEAVPYIAPAGGKRKRKSRKKRCASRAGHNNVDELEDSEDLSDEGTEEDDEQQNGNEREEEGEEKEKEEKEEEKEKEKETEKDKEHQDDTLPAGGKKLENGGEEQKKPLTAADIFAAALGKKTTPPASPQKNETDTPPVANHTDS